jgi:DNA polymerase III sliding clamp (beta) subunit (PCNA family)
VTKCQFYVATFAAAVERAARIAPNKGIAYDKAAGVILKVDPDEQSACLLSTDLEVMYREEICDVKDYGDEAVEWRLPSDLFSGIIGGLPLDKNVSIRDDGPRQVRIQCGRKQAKLRTMAADLFPQWSRVDRSALKPVPSFAHRVSQVAWATDRDAAPLTGVHIDGTHLTATDKYRLARVPCDVPVDEPVTVAMRVLAPVLKGLLGDVCIGATARHMLLTVGDEIEVTCVLYEKKFPSVAKALREDFTLTAKVHRETLVDSVSSMLVLVKQERYPRMEIDFEEGAISMFMTVPEVGDMNDIIEAELEGTFPFSVTYNPEFILRALEATSGEYVYWGLGPNRMQISRIKDGDYIAYLMPLAQLAQTKGTS